MKAVVARLHSPLLAYWVSPHETFVWVVTATRRRQRAQDPGRGQAVRGVGARRLGGTGYGGTRAAAAPPRQRRAKTSPARFGTDELRELYDLLIQPVREALERQAARVWTIIPHGPLFRVSFASLVDDRGRYLIERLRTALRARGRRAPVHREESSRRGDPDRTARRGSRSALQGRPSPSLDRSALPRLPGAAARGRRGRAAARRACRGAGRASRRPRRACAASSPGAIFSTSPPTPS